MHITSLDSRQSMGYHWRLYGWKPIVYMVIKASLGEFHRPGFQDVKLWYEIDVSLNA
jgi:hypothetical protein